MARGSNYLRTYVPSKRVKAAHRAFNADEANPGDCPLKTFAASEQGGFDKVCQDWFNNKAIGGRGAQRYAGKRGLRYT